MPHMTQAFPFEWKGFNFSAELSDHLTGDDRSFIMIFDGTGAVQKISFEQPASSWQDLKKQLEETNQSYLFYSFSDIKFHKARGRDTSKAYIEVRRRGFRPITQ